ERSALGVVTASAGYPASSSKGDVISGLNNKFDDGVKVFHAGTAEQDDATVTAGGRVLCVTALGDSVTDAQARAYEALAGISYDGMIYRKDIGYRAVAREQE
ncbi:MAG: phosphoribosylglycinamide synthetase C domain-containing protein, partial [Gammaproteobacteria bacterium]